MPASLLFALLGLLCFDLFCFAFNFAYFCCFAFDFACLFTVIGLPCLVLLCSKASKFEMFTGSAGSISQCARPGSLLERRSNAPLPHP